MSVTKVQPDAGEMRFQKPFIIFWILNFLCWDIVFIYEHLVYLVNSGSSTQLLSSAVEIGLLPRLCDSTLLLLLLRWYDSNMIY